MKEGYYWYLPDELDHGDWHNDSQDPIVVRVASNGRRCYMVGSDYTYDVKDALGRFVPIEPPAK